MLKTSARNWAPESWGGLKTRIPLLRQHLELANPNFAEVGAGARNLIPKGAKTSFQNRNKEVDQPSTSEFRLKSPPLRLHTDCASRASPLPRRCCGQLVDKALFHKRDRRDSNVVKSDF
jgi:hypothetical protein